MYSIIFLLKQILSFIQGKFEYTKKNILIVRQDDQGTNNSNFC